MTDSRDKSFSVESADVTSSAPGLSEDRLYHVLSSRQRRRILRFLLDERECSIEELATVLAGWRAAETGRIVSPADRRTILVTLHHTDLPLLGDAGFVTFDAAEDVVRIEPLDEPVIELILESVEREDATAR